MRSFALIAVCFVAGCLRNAPRQPGLCTDEEIRKLADFDIDNESNGLLGIFDIKCLDVVPSGSSRPRAVVFAAMGIDDARVEDFRQTHSDNVVFLWGRVSPS